jgi:RNA polymerase sigma-70 factor, ECF subfamily
LYFESKNIDSILASCKKGSKEGQKELYRLYFGFGKSICLRYSQSKEDAEEVLNDGFMKVFNKIESYDSSKSFKAWFHTILVNTCIDYYRKKNKLIFEFDDAHYEGIFEEESAIDKISAEDILAMVQRLSPAYRTVFLLYAVDGYSHKEIATMLKINEVTSRTNFMKAKLKLQKMIKMSQQVNILQPSFKNKLYEN